MQHCWNLWSDTLSWAVFRLIVWPQLSGCFNYMCGSAIKLLSFYFLIQRRICHLGVSRELCWGQLVTTCHRGPSSYSHSVILMWVDPSRTWQWDFTYRTHKKCIYRTGTVITSRENITWKKIQIFICHLSDSFHLWKKIMKVCRPSSFQNIYKKNHFHHCKKSKEKYTLSSTKKIVKLHHQKKIKLCQWCCLSKSSSCYVVKEKIFSSCRLKKIQ